MDSEKLVVFDKYQNAVDANIVKGALEASGIPAGVMGDSTANAVWMAPVMVVVFRRDLENAVKAIYGEEMSYDDYRDDMTLKQFENWRACNRAFCEFALKCHPELGAHDNRRRRDLYSLAKDALDRRDLDTLVKMAASVN